MTDKMAIGCLTHGEYYTIPKSDYGKAEIYKIHNSYIIFEIPEYGGIPIFSFVSNDIDDIIKNIELWT